MTPAPVCRTCGSSRVSSHGSLPQGVEFAGRRLESPIAGGELWSCRACGLRFRHPILADAQYDDLYRQGGHDVWTVPQSNREDFRIIRDLLAEHTAPADILDVGCYDGQLLSMLPNNYRRFGVEINTAAVARARAAHIEIVADSIDRLDGVERKFDVVTACDVIEHTSNPLSFLRALRRLLKPQGRVVISTGDPDAWLWKVSGAKFWYCYFPEHISFTGAKWFANMSRKADLSVTQLTPFNYFYRRTPNRESIKILRRTAKHLLRNLGRAAESRPGFSPPGCGATRDHVVCVMTAS